MAIYKQDGSAFADIMAGGDYIDKRGREYIQDIVESLIKDEGYFPIAKVPATGKKDEPSTVGHGYAGPEVVSGVTRMSRAEALANLREGIYTRLPNIRKKIPSFDKLPRNAQVELVNSWYRNSVRKSPNTIDRINEGNLTEAGKEYLRNKEYRLSMEPDSKFRGVAPRMRRLSDALISAGTEQEGLKRFLDAELAPSPFG